MDVLHENLAAAVLGMDLYSGRDSAATVHRVAP